VSEEARVTPSPMLTSGKHTAIQKLVLTTTQDLWWFGLLMVRWSRSTKLLFIEPY